MPLLFSLLACGPGERVGIGLDEARPTDEPAPADPGPGGPTWHADVAPVVAEHCGGCHATGGIAPFALDNYASAAAMATASALAIEEGTMPPFDAYEDGDCAPRAGWVGDPRLSDAEKALIRAWADAGAPEGDPATAAPLPDVAPRGLEDVDVEVAPPEGYVTGGDDDEFVCVAMDVGLDHDAWVTGLEIEPGNPLVNHHVVVWTDPGGESAAWGDAYQRDCFGFTGLTGSMPLGVWTPGSDPTVFPEDAGVALSAGSRVVMQIHYHPSGVEAAEPDRTTLRLRLDDTAPEHLAMLIGIGNFASESQGLEPGPDDRGAPEFHIPAGVAGHTETMALALPAIPELRVFSVMPHMHYIGTNLEARVAHADPAAGEPEDECLVQSGWNFGWQRTYTYDAPVESLPAIRSFDSFWLQCTYDNTLQNPWVVKALADAGLSEPVDVELGEGTLDEMCILIVGLVL